MTHQFHTLTVGHHCWWFMVLVCATAATLSAGTEMGTYHDLPIPSEYPIHYIPVGLDSAVASPLPIWPEWTLDENIYAFVVSMGARAFHDASGQDERTLSHILNSLRDSIMSMNSTTYVVSPRGKGASRNLADSSSGLESVERTLPHVVIPLLLDGEASLVIHVYDSFSSGKNEKDMFETTAKLFLEQQLHINLGTLNKADGHSPALQHFQRLLSSQIKLTTERHLGSKEIFEAAIHRGPNTEPISCEGCFKNNRANKQRSQKTIFCVRGEKQACTDE